MSNNDGAVGLLPTLGVVRMHRHRLPLTRREVMPVMGFGVLIWVLLILAVLWSVKVVADRKSGDGGNGGGSRRPLDILEERYARGELSEQEFEERKRVLEES
jgi:uncharacterized membrane protein